MAMNKFNAMESNSMKSLTDCLYFMNGHCKFGEKCMYRHSLKAKKQLTRCNKWPDSCRKIQCSFRHPVIMAQPKVTTSNTLTSRLSKDNLVSFFWNIENVPIPKGQKPFDIIQRIRQKLVIEPSLQEAAFSCFCNIYSISQDNQQSLHHANVRIIHVPDRKPGAVDRQIMLELDRFERVHRPPATVVLISGDIDFVGKLNDLRHQAGFQVIVIHNKLAKEELKATVNAHYPWELFTQQQQQQQQQQQSVRITNQLYPTGNERPNRMRHSSSSGSIRRRDPSPYPSNRQVPIINNQDIQKLKCPKCPREFESIQSLQYHQNTKNHLFNCPVCKETFLTQTGQIQHQKDKKHNVRDYRCNQCNRYFSKIESLNQHQQATGHISPLMQLTDNRRFSLQATSSPLLPSSNHDENKDDQDPMLIILRGIESIKQYYEKHGLRID
ncbi:unnamed protein product [Rotaria sp. Silwood1]|nr:unnamed protein product [Rotaria sp. Silwood1]